MWWVRQIYYVRANFTERRAIETDNLGSLQASAWEQTAVLSSSQEQSIELLAAACSQRPVPQHVSHLSPKQPTGFFAEHPTLFCMWCQAALTQCDNNAAG